MSLTLSRPFGASYHLPWPRANGETSDVMIYGAARRIDAPVSIDPINNAVVRSLRIPASRTALARASKVTKSRKRRATAILNDDNNESSTMTATKMRCVRMDARGEILINLPG